MPDEVLLHIFSFLDGKSLCQTASVDLRLYNLAKDSLGMSKIAKVLFPAQINCLDKFTKKDIDHLIYLRFVRSFLKGREEVTKLSGTLSLSEKGGLLKESQWIQRYFHQIVKLPMIDIKYLPEELFYERELTTLELGNNRISELPSSIVRQDQLKVLHLGQNEFEQFPIDILKLKKLEALNLGQNKMTALPEEIGNMLSLKVLNLGGCEITTLPESLNRKDLTIYIPHNLHHLHRPDWKCTIKCYPLQKHAVQ